MDSRIFLAPIGGKREVKGDIVQHCASPYGVTLRRNHRFNDKCGLYRPELSTERSARSPTLLELSVSAQLLTCYCACAIWSLPSRGDRAQTVLSSRREDVQLRSEMVRREERVWCPVLHMSCLFLLAGGGEANDDHRAQGHAPGKVSGSGVLVPGSVL